MKAEILIRAATAEDVDEVVALERGVAEAPHWNRVEYEAMVSPERTSLAETPTGEQGGVRRCLLVAEIEGRLAGFA
ncbi:MAG TPA: hypothetical protein VF214_07930, partial [Edaphobacter sp.]